MYVFIFRARVLAGDCKLTLMSASCRNTRLFEFVEKVVCGILYPQVQPLVNVNINADKYVYERSPTLVTDSVKLTSVQ